MKLLLLLLAFCAVFGLGYYTGQRPDEVKQKLRDLSGEVLEKTIGFEQGMVLQREFLRAKERLVEGKAKLLDHEYEEAASELASMLNHLRQALNAGQDGTLRKHVEALMEDIQQIQDRLARGEGVSRETLTVIQQKLDDLMH